MVMDFKELKTIVNDEITGRLDHSLMVRAGSEAAKRVEGLSERIVVVDYQPTCENMVTDFANRIMAKLPVNVQLCTVRLYETATSFAEWHACDN
jgi:6-pyruvoyltetrahydropterin/6-carboxytetrahydropterin synthase